jgi:hypothetical protein
MIWALGAEMEIDAVSDTQTVIGALLTILSPVIGLAILADSLIGNHVFNIIKSIRVLFLK